MLQMKADFDFESWGLLHMDAKDLRDHAQWAIALVLAGVAMAVPSIVASDKNTFLIALGMILYGVGQMRNRQIQQSIISDGYGRPHSILTGNPHYFTIVGTTLSIAGMALFGLGLYRLVFA